MIVIKIGGSVLCKDPTHVVSDLANYWKDSVVVHGGGCFVNAVMERMGLTPRYLTHPGGLRSRLVDEETLRAYVMGVMYLNKVIVAKLSALGVPAIGISGADNAVVVAKRKERVMVVDERGRQRVVDGGYSGRITSVKGDLLMPPPLKVLAPIAVSPDGLLLNVDGDTLALRVAEAVGASRLILLSDVDGLLLEGKLVERLDAEGIREALGHRDVSGGMKRKLSVVLEAAEKGMEVVISNGIAEAPIGRAMKGVGTLVSPRRG